MTRVSKIPFDDELEELEKNQRAVLSGNYFPKKRRFIRNRPSRWKRFSILDFVFHKNSLKQWFRVQVPETAVAASSATEIHIRHIGTRAIAFYGQARLVAKILPDNHPVNRNLEGVKAFNRSGPAQLGVAQPRLGPHDRDGRSGGRALNPFRHRTAPIGNGAASRQG